MRIYGGEGRFYLSNGFLFCTLTKSDYTNAPLPASTPPERVVRVDDRELVMADAMGHESVARRTSK